MRDPSEVGHVEGRSLDDDDNNTGTNEYVRLLLNLWKAYQEGDEKDLVKGTNQISLVAWTASHI